MTARTTLITWIFWPPAPVRTTSELGLLLRGRPRRRRGRRCGDRHRGRGGDALLLQLVLQLDELEDVAQLLDDLVGVCLRCYASSVSAEACSASAESARQGLLLLRVLLQLRVLLRPLVLPRLLVLPRPEPRESLPPSLLRLRLGLGLRHRLALLLELLDAGVEDVHQVAGGAVNSPTTVVSGPATTLTSWPRSTSAGGRASRGS